MAVDHMQQHEGGLVRSALALFPLAIRRRRKAGGARELSLAEAGLPTHALDVDGKNCRDLDDVAGLAAGVGDGILEAGYDAVEYLLAHCRLLLRIAAFRVAISFFRALLCAADRSSC